MRLATADLRDALKATSVAISARPDVVALSAVRITESADQTVEFSATDWSTWVTRKIGSRGDGGFTAFVPHRTLTAIAKVVTSPDVDLTLDGGRLKVSSGRSVWTAPLVDDSTVAGSPPAPPEYAVVDGESFARAVHATAIATSSRDTLPALAALRLEPVDDILTFAGTDRYRIHGTSIPSKSDRQSDVAYPDAEILDRLAGDVAGELTLLFDGQMFGMRNDSLQVITRTLEGKTPRFDDFTAGVRLSGGKTVVSAHALSAALKSVAFALDTNAAAILTVTEDEFRVTATGDDGDGDVPVESHEHEGDSIRIGVNPKFTLDAISAVDSKTITLRWGTAAFRPFLLDGEDGDTHVVVMPIRLPG